MDSTGEDSSHEGKQAEKEEEEEEEGEAGAGREGKEEPREADGSAEVVEEEEEEEEEEEIDVALIRNMTQKLSTEPVKVRVHDVQIKGNTRTKDSVIEAQLKEVRSVETMQELLQESVRANSRLRALGIFDKCVITLDAGPNELPGTVRNLIVIHLLLFLLLLLIRSSFIHARNRNPNFETQKNQLHSRQKQKP
jgi:outer membrane protein insertion porin family